MPIAFCYFTIPVDKLDFPGLTADWSKEIQVNQQDITLHAISHFQQYGQPYGVMVNLFLPTLWSAADVANIQLALLKMLVKYTRLPEKDIFIMTSLIQSGHVVEQGKITRWD